MEKKESLITYVDYGYIKCNVSELMKKNNLTRTQIVKRTGIHHETIERYMNNTAYRYDAEVLAKLCCIFNCTIDKILTYVEKKNK